MEDEWRGEREKRKNMSGDERRSRMGRGGFGEGEARILEGEERGGGEDKE